MEEIRLAIQQKRPLLLFYVCRSIVVLWFFLAATVIGLLSFFVSKNLWLLLVPLILFMTLAIPTIIAYFVIRCPSCNKLPLMEPFSGPCHPNSKNYKWVGGKTAVVIEILKVKQYTCIRCGEDIILDI
jgi:DNA-directed RNA polymerase subunit RPC12/RpoP